MYLVIKKRGSQLLLIHEKVGKSWFFVSSKGTRTLPYISIGSLISCHVDIIRNRITDMDLEYMPECVTYEQLQCLHDIIKILDTVVPQGAHVEGLYAYLQHMYAFLATSNRQQQVVCRLQIFSLLGLLPEHAGWLSLAQKTQYNFMQNSVSCAAHKMASQAVKFCMSSLHNL